MPKMLKIECRHCGRLTTNVAFCSQRCIALFNIKYKIKKVSGSIHSQWKGGKKKHSKGYVLILRPNHPRANIDGYVYEHILMAEKKYGRPIIYPEVVHHIDLNKKNNHPDNLILFLNDTCHLAYHRGLKQNPLPDYPEKRGSHER